MATYTSFRQFRSYPKAALLAHARLLIVVNARVTSLCFRAYISSIVLDVR